MKTCFSRLALVSFAAVGVLIAAQAPNEQAPPPPAAQTHRPVDPQQQLNHLTKKLSLTADQQNQILPILTDRQQQVGSIMSDASLTQKQRHAKLKAVRSDAESKIRNILTDAQRTAYDQMQQEARERARTRRETTVQ